jgi:ankyrin repeat protein
MKNFFFELPAEIFQKIAECLPTRDAASLASVNHKAYTSVNGMVQDRLGPEFDRLLTEAVASRLEFPPVDAVTSTASANAHSQRSRLKDVTKDMAKLHARLSRFFGGLPPGIRSVQRGQALAQAISKPDSYGRTLLHAAIQEREVSVNDVRGLLEGGANVAARSWHDDRAALVDLIRYGSVEKLAPFWAAGVQPNTEIDFRSLLSWAIGFERTEMVEALLKAGSSPDLKSQTYNARTLLQDLADKNASVLCHEIAQLLVEYRADVNRCGRGRDTPLHLACKHGNEDLVRLLLEAGAKTHYLNAKRQTPLDVARARGHSNCVALLEDCDQAGETSRVGGAAHREKKARLEEISLQRQAQQTPQSEPDIQTPVPRTSRSPGPHERKPICRGGQKIRS